MDAILNLLTFFVLIIGVTYALPHLRDSIWTAVGIVALALCFIAILQDIGGIRDRLGEFASFILESLADDAEKKG